MVFTKSVAGQTTLQLITKQNFSSRLDKQR